MSAWDRRAGRAGETALAYQKFCVYRDLGPERSLARVGQILGVSTTVCESLSTKHGWVERADQWDAHLRHIQDRAFLNEAAKRSRQRAQAAEALLGKAILALKNLDLGSPDEKLPPTMLGAIALTVKTASELSRLEDNLETQRSRVVVTDARTVLSQLPAEVRRELLRTLARKRDTQRTAASPAPLGIPDGEDFGDGDEGEADGD